MGVALTTDQAKALGKGTDATIKRTKPKEPPAPKTITVTYTLTVDVVEGCDDGLTTKVEMNAMLLRGIRGVRKVGVTEAGLPTTLKIVAKPQRYMNASEAAEIANVSVSTAVRYLQSGFWSGEKHGNQWRMSIDAALPVKSRQRKQAAKAKARAA